MAKNLMNRVPPEELPEDLRRMHAASLSVAGDSDRLEVFGNHPDLYRWYQQGFYGAVFEGEAGMKVERRWKELLRLKLSLENGCFVCNAHNVPAAEAAGYSQEQIDAMGDSASPLFSPQEQAVLSLAELFLIRNTEPELTGELHARLRTFFSDAEILELGLTATILSGWTKLMFAYDIITRECPIDSPERGLSPSRTHIAAAAG